MATKKITQLDELSNADDSDVLVIVDVSEGETKKITKNNFLVGTGHTIELSLDPSTYVLTLTLKNEAGTTLSTQSVNLPSEDALTNITYSNGMLTLTKQSGETSTVDISDLIAALKSVVGIDTDTYNSSLTYNVGDIVVQNEKIYKAKEDNLTGTFDVTKWDEISLYEYQKIQDEELASLKAESEELISDLEEQKEKEKNFKSQLPQVKGEGYSATLNDTIEDDFTQFDPEGHSDQETTEGYNQYYMNYNNVTNTFGGVTIISTKTGYSLNGTRTSTSTSAFTLINRKLKLSAGTYTLKLKKASLFKVGLSKPDYSQIKILAIGVTSGTFTLSEETDICMTIGFQEAGTFDEENELMIYSGTEDKPFEQYTFGASPNSNYEQPIKSSGENIQLFDKSTATNERLDEDGTTVGGTTTMKTTDFIPIDINETYYKTITNSARVKLFDTNKNVITSTGWDITNFGDAKSFTIPSNFSTAKYIRFSIMNEYVDTFKLEKGNKATPWSPFGMGSINERIVNKNWLNVSDFSKSVNAATFSYSNGIFKINGSNSGGSNVDITSYFDLNLINLLINKEATFSMKCATNNYAVEVKLQTATNNYFYQLKSSNRLSQTKTISEKILKVVAFVPSATYDNFTFNLQLEEGPTESSYTSHKGQTKTYYTQAPFRSVGDIRDIFFKNTVDNPYYDENLTLNGWYEKHYIDREVFDGTENWALSNNGNFFKLVNADIPAVSSSSAIPLALSNYYIATSYNNINNALVDYGFGFGSTDHRIDIRNKDITTLSDFKTWLSTHNVEVEFIAIEPLNLPCTPEQTQQLESIPETFKGQTNVITMDEIAAYLKVAGIYDLNKLITRVEVIESEV